MPLRHAVALALVFAALPAHALTFTTEENPPLNFARDGQVAGVSTAIVREMAKRAGVPAEFALLPWAQAYSRGLEGRDTCVYSTVRNAERMQLFQWVGPIARGEWSLFGRQGFPEEVKKLDEMKGLRVGVQNDARVAYLRGRGFTNLVIAERQLDLAAMLGTDFKQLGRIDLWMAQTFGAPEVAKAAGVGDLKVVFSGLMNQDYWLACGKGVAAETVKALNDALMGMRKDGTFKQLTAPPPAAR